MQVDDGYPVSVGPVALSQQANERDCCLRTTVHPAIQGFTAGTTSALAACMAREESTKAEPQRIGNTLAPRLVANAGPSVRPYEVQPKGVTGKLRGYARVHYYANSHFSALNLDDDNKCGPAAVMTAKLWHDRRWLPQADLIKYSDNYGWLTGDGPDLGIAGTSPGGMGFDLRKRGIPHQVHYFRGEESLLELVKQQVANGRPCIVLIDWRLDRISAHWAIAYAHDDTHLYLTNDQPEGRSFSKMIHYFGNLGKAFAGGGCFELPKITQAK